MTTQQTPTEQTSPTLDDQAYVFHQLDAYPWDSDEEFQGGLRAILGDNVTDPEQRSRITIRAKCYYYTRKAGVPVDYQSYKTWLDNGGSFSNGTAQQPLFSNDIDSGYTAPVPPAVSQADSSTAGDGGMGNAPKPASFAEICDMIAEGKPIPGIKDIPDTILEGQASSSTAGRRKKPWEKDANGETQAAVGAETEGAKLSWMR